MSKYTIVISFDAVSSNDIEVLKKMPNFKRIIEGGSLIKNVKSVYPTLTYPAHTTIVTGKHPKSHGIIDNTKFKLGDNKPNWYWYSKDIKGETLYNLAHKSGLTTCSILWPVTGRSSITYNMPEIFCTKSYHNQIIMSALAGSIGYQLEINKLYGNIRQGIRQPYLDDFVLEATKYTINKYMPNLMLIHLTDVDTCRHEHGYNSTEANDALKRHDKRLGEILRALDVRGVLEETSLIALGDHSQLDAEHVVKINKLFEDEELLEIKNGKIISYKAICKSLDGSAYIYIKSKEDIEEVRSILSKYTVEVNGPIEEIFTREEAVSLGADPNCSLMIEAINGYYFVDEVQGEFIEKINNRHRAVHGYLPSKKDYDTFFIAYGNKFKSGFVKNEGELVNHGPTLAKVIGVKLKDSEGIVENEIFVVK